MGGVQLSAGERVVIQNEPGAAVQSSGADLVLFVTDERSEHYGGGMFSGNKAQATGR